MNEVSLIAPTAEPPPRPIPQTHPTLPHPPSHPPPYVCVCEITHTLTVCVAGGDINNP